MSGDRASTLSEQSIELIHLVIDGEATPRQHAELQEILARSAEARQFYESMRELAQSLDSVPPAAAPGLKSDVLAVLRTRRPAATVPFPAARFRRRVVLGAAWAAAAVLAIVLAVDRLILTGGKLDRVVPAQAAASLPPRDVNAWPLLTRVESEGGALTIRRSGDRYALQFLPEPEETLTISWDDEKLDFLSESSDGIVVLQRREGAAGSAAVSVLLEDKPILQTSIDLS